MRFNGNFKTKNHSKYKAHKFLSLVLSMSLAMQPLYGGTAFANGKGSIKFTIDDSVQSGDVTGINVTADYSKLMDGNTSSTFTGNFSTLTQIMGMPGKTETKEQDRGTYVYMVDATKNVSTYNTAGNKDKSKQGIAPHLIDDAYVTEQDKIIAYPDGSESSRMFVKIGSVNVAEGSTENVVVNRKFNTTFSAVDGSGAATDASLNEAGFDPQHNIKFTEKTIINAKEVNSSLNNKLFYSLRGNYNGKYLGDARYKKQDFVLEVNDNGQNQLTLEKRKSSVPVILIFESNNNGELVIEKTIPYTFQKGAGTVHNGNINIDNAIDFKMSESSWKEGSVDIKPVRYYITHLEVNEDFDSDLKMTVTANDRYTTTIEKDSIANSKVFGLTDVVIIKIKQKEGAQSGSGTETKELASFKSSADFWSEDEKSEVEENMNTKWIVEHDKARFKQIGLKQGNDEGQLNPKIKAIFDADQSGDIKEIKIGRAIVRGTIGSVAELADQKKKEKLNDRIRDSIIEYYLNQDLNLTPDQRKNGIVSDVTTYDFMQNVGTFKKVEFSDYIKAVAKAAGSKTNLQVYVELAKEGLPNPQSPTNEDVDYNSLTKENYETPMSLNVNILDNNKLQIMAMQATEGDIYNAPLSVNSSDKGTYISLEKADIDKITNVESIVDSVKAGKRIVIEGKKSEAEFLFKRVLPEQNTEILQLLKTPGLTKVNIYIKNLPVIKLTNKPVEGEMSFEVRVLPGVHREFSNNTFNTPNAFGYYSISKLESTKGLKITNDIPAEMMKTFFDFKVNIFADEQDYPVFTQMISPLKVQPDFISNSNTSKIAYAVEMVGPNAPSGFSKILNGKRFKFESNTPGGSNNNGNALEEINSSYFDSEFNFSKDRQMSSFMLKSVKEEGGVLELSVEPVTNLTNDIFVGYKDYTDFNKNTLAVVVKGLTEDKAALGANINKVKFVSKFDNSLEGRIVVELTSRLGEGKPVYRKAFPMTAGSIFGGGSFKELNIAEMLPGKDISNYGMLIYVVNTPHIKLESDNENTIRFRLQPRLGEISKDENGNKIKPLDMVSNKSLNSSSSSKAIILDYNPIYKKLYTPVELIINNDDTKVTSMSVIKSYTGGDLVIPANGNKYILTNFMKDVGGNDLNRDQVIALSNINSNRARATDYNILGHTRVNSSNLDAINHGITLKHNEVNRDLTKPEVDVVVNDVLNALSANVATDNIFAKVVIHDYEGNKQNIKFELVKHTATGQEVVEEVTLDSARKIVRFNKRTPENGIKYQIRGKAGEGYTFKYYPTYIVVQKGTDNEVEKVSLEGNVTWRIPYEEGTSIVAVGDNGKSHSVPTPREGKYQMIVPGKTEAGANITYTMKFVSNKPSIKGEFAGKDLTIDKNENKGSIEKSLNLDLADDDKVTIELKGNGKKIAEKEVTKNDKTIVFDNLPIKDENGKDIDYVIEIADKDKSKFKFEEKNGVITIVNENKVEQPKPEGYDKSLLRGKLIWEVKDEGVALAISYSKGTERLEKVFTKQHQWFHIGEGNPSTAELRIITPANYDKKIVVDRNVNIEKVGDKQIFNLFLTIREQTDEEIPPVGNEIGGTVKWKVLENGIKVRLVLTKDGKELETLTLTNKDKEYKFKTVAEEKAKYKVSVSVMKPFGLKHSVSVKAKANNRRAHDLIVYLSDKGADGGIFKIENDKITEVPDVANLVPNAKTGIIVKPESKLVTGKIFYTFKDGMPPFKVVLTKLGAKPIILEALFKTQGSKFTFKNLKGSEYRLTLELPEGYTGAIGANGSVFITKVKQNKKFN